MKRATAISKRPRPRAVVQSRNRTLPDCHVRPRLKGLLVALALCLAVVACRVVFAETKAPARPPNAKGKIPLVLQSIAFAKHENLDITADQLRARLREANRALQRKTSPTDVACYVKFDLSGTLPDFVDTGDYSFEIIDSPVEINALKTSVPTLVKIVREIVGFQCGPEPSPLGYDGCTAPGHIVLREAFPPLTFPHEFLHHKGIATHDSTPGRVMSQPPGGELDQAQCALLKGQ